MKIAKVIEKNLIILSSNNCLIDLPSFIFFLYHEPIYALVNKHRIKLFL